MQDPYEPIETSVAHSLTNAMDHAKTTDAFRNLIGRAVVMITSPLIRCSNVITVLIYFGL